MKRLEIFTLASCMVIHAVTGAVARPFERQVVNCESTVQGIWLKPGRYELLLETGGGSGATYNNFYTFASDRISRDKLIAKIAFTFSFSGGRGVENNFVEWANGQKEGVKYKPLNSSFYKFEYSFEKGGYLRCINVSRD